MQSFAINMMDII